MKYINTLVLSLFVVAGTLAFSPFAFAQTYYQPSYSYSNNYPYNQGYNNYNQYNAQGYNSYAQNTNRVPFYISQPVTTATVGDSYIYGVRAQDPDANSITYILTQAPVGMAMNPVTHTIVWTPTQAGSYAVTVSVFDYTNVWANQSFVITVAPAKAVAVTPQSSGSGYSIFQSKVKPLAISNIQVTSGPRNINNTVSNANCSAAVSWITSAPSVGQVVYGPTSQPSAASFQYAQAIGEGASPSAIHSVTLPSCLAEQTYYFRVIAYTNSEHVVSDEQTILPLPIQVSGESSAPAITLLPDSTSGRASVIGTIGRLILNPIVLVLIIAGLIFFIVKKLWDAGKPPVEHGGPADTVEPAIAIPHH